MMIHQQFLRKTLSLPVMIGISLFAPKLMLGGGIIGIIAGIVFFSYLITIYLYSIKLHKKLKQQIRKYGQPTDI